MATDYEHSFAAYQNLVPVGEAGSGVAILVAGVPGAGKTTLAEGLARSAARRRYRAVAESLGGRFVGLECTCSDESLHRARVEGRERGIPGWSSTVTWEHVQRMKSLWEPWEEPHLVLDSATQSSDKMLELALAEVASAVRAR